MGQPVTVQPGVQLVRQNQPDGGRATLRLHHQMLLECSVIVGIRVYKIQQTQLTSITILNRTVPERYATGQTVVQRMRMQLLRLLHTSIRLLLQKTEYIGAIVMRIVKNRRIIIPHYMLLRQKLLATGQRIVQQQEVHIALLRTQTSSLYHQIRRAG
jgi:hypothetical protein